MGDCLGRSNGDKVLFASREDRLADGNKELRLIESPNVYRALTETIKPTITIDDEIIAGIIKSFGIYFSIYIDLSVYEAAGKSSRLSAKLREAASGVYDTLLLNLVILIREHDGSVEDFIVGLRSLEVTFERDALQAVETQWEKLKKAEAALSTANFKFILNNTLKLGAVFVSGAAIAGGTGGIGLVLSIHTVVTGLRTFFNDLKLLAKDMEEHRAKLEADFEALYEYFTENKIQANLIDTLRTLQFTIVGGSKRTLKNTKKSFGTYQEKLLRIDLDADSLSGQVTDFLDMQESYNANKIELLNSLEPGPGLEKTEEIIKKLTYVKENMDHAIDETAKLLKKIDDINLNIAEGELFIPKAKKRIEAISENKSFALDVFERAFTGAIQGAKIGGGIGKIVEEGANECEKLIPVANNLSAYGQDLYKWIKEQTG